MKKIVVSIMILILFTISGCFSFNPPNVCEDNDGDGYGLPGSTACDFSATDCDDNNAAVNPGATEICDNGLDDDCVGGDLTCPPQCVDADGDSRGLNCVAGSDCDDNDASVWSFRSCNYNGNSCGNYNLCLVSCPVPPMEICGNDVDENCDGVVEQCGSSGSLYSAAYPLTWPPPLENLDNVGAESNPTGNPIGGYHGYDRIVSPSDADYIVYNKEEFLYLFEFYDDYRNQRVQPGDIVYIDDNAVIDLTGVWGLFFPDNITLASGRGRDFSKGALIKNTQQIFGPEGGRTLFIMGGPNIRITGLRIEGPDKSTQKTRHAAIFYGNPPRADLQGSFYEMGTAVAINSRYPFFEFDNNEVFGWTYAVGLSSATPEFGNHWAYGGANPTYGYNSSMNAWIHHNYMHHNIRAGLGYGVSVAGFTADTAVSTLIEGNLFKRNRHSITSVHNGHSSYHARYNLILEDGTHYQIDRHGGGTGYGGLYTIVDHNTHRYSKLQGLGLTGVPGPAYPPGVNRIYNNWNYELRLSSCCGSDWGGQVPIFGNLANTLPPQGTVLLNPVLSVDKDDVKIGEVISFSAADSVAGTNALSYVCWNYGDSTPEDCDYVDVVKTHSYSAPGRYLVTLKVFDIKGVVIDTTRSIIVHPSNPDAVVLSFWQRDSFNQYNTNDSSGYFKKRVLVDNHVVWERDVNADGWEWEQIVVDITPYVSDTSVIDFQVQSLQNFLMQPYPAYHPFEFFELYVDDIYVFNRDYSFENFGDWEADYFGYDGIVGINGFIPSDGAVHFYKVGDPWWNGHTSFESVHTGKYSFMIDSGYRMNSTAGTTRGVKQTILAPVAKNLIDIKSNNEGVVSDYSSNQRAVSFAGSVNADNNFINDFFGYSKSLNGDNYISVSGVDLSQGWVLDLNVFLPNVNSPSTLMYSSSGSNYVHVYYSPANQVILKTNSAEVSCNLPQLSHNRFNKIVVGTSCAGGNCVLSCANNGVVNTFSGNPSIALAGTSSVSFGGYSGGSMNMFGAINNAKLLRGSLSSSSFTDLSIDKLQGAWYFRDGTNGIIQDASLFDIDIAVPGTLNFGSDGQRRFAQFTQSGPTITIARNQAMIVQDDFSIEVIGRFNEMNKSFTFINGLPYRITNEGWIDPGWAGNNKLRLELKLSDDSLYISDHAGYGWQGLISFNMLEDDKWNHVVFTKEGNYLRTYINGKVNRKLFSPGVPYDNSVVNNLLMGGFDGDIQRFAVYDKVLRDADVEAKFKSSNLGCSDSDGDGYGTFPRSGVVNGCRFDGFDCDDGNVGINPVNGGC